MLKDVVDILFDDKVVWWIFIDGSWLFYIFCNGYFLFVNLVVKEKFVFVV